jgi:hypothetical protein
MSSAKRLSAAVLAIVVLVFAAVTFGAGSASAYPSGTSPQIALSHNSGPVGDSVNVVGTHFTPHKTATLTFHSASFALGVVNVNGQGAFTVTITIPNAGVGAHTVDGLDNASGQSASADFTITASGAGGAGGGLASTGVAVLGIASLGLVLLVGGGLMLLAGRRRKVVA